MEEQNEKKQQQQQLLFNELYSTTITTIDRIETRIFCLNGNDINLTFLQADLEMLINITFLIIVNDASFSPKRNESNMCNKKPVSEYSVFISRITFLV